MDTLKDKHSAFIKQPPLSLVSHLSSGLPTVILSVWILQSQIYDYGKDVYFISIYTLRV